MVSGLRFKQASPEVAQLPIGDVVAEEGEALAAAGLDEPGDKQPIDGPGRLLAAHQALKPGAIRRRGELPKPDPAALEEIEHHPEMLQLFFDDLRHRPRQWQAIDIRKEEIHRHAGGLLLAMGVVDEELLEMPLHLRKPAPGCRLLQ